MTLLMMKVTLFNSWLELEGNKDSHQKTEYLQKMRSLKYGMDLVD